MSSLVESSVCVNLHFSVCGKMCIICIYIYIFFTLPKICSQRVKSCVQPNTGDLLSQAVNGGRTPRTGRVQG